MNLKNTETLLLTIDALIEFRVLFAISSDACCLETSLNKSKQNKLKSESTRMPNDCVYFVPGLLRTYLIRYSRISKANADYH